MLLLDRQPGVGVRCSEIERRRTGAPKGRRAARDETWRGVPSGGESSHSRKRSLAAGAAVLFALTACSSGSGDDEVGADNAGDWYVAANATDGGDGSRARPFNSLQAAEQASKARDTIVVLPAPLDVAPLDGGIALKPGQRLIGSGPEVVQRQPNVAVAGANPLAALPRIRNSNVLRLNGDAVRLARDSEVRNLVITESARGGVYGLNVPGAVVQCNDVSGHNTLCFIGFTVEPFTAPTTGPYFGVPAVLPAGWAGIMIDADNGSGAVTINDNYVHDGACGNGIDLRINGSADYVAEISRNFITNLKHGPLYQAEELHLVHAITTQITDQARLMANSTDNTQTFIGAPGADCEGLFMNLADSATASWSIDRNFFAHGIGGFSCNGMEFIISNGNAQGEMFLSNSHFEDNPGDMFEQANLGSGSTSVLELDNIVVKDTHERGGNPDAGGLPFNLGECLLMGSTGTGNTTRLVIRDSDFSGCNNGLSILSGVNLTTNLLGGVTTGQIPGDPIGPDGLMQVEISNTAFHDNANNNIVLGVIAGLRKLDVKIENSDFSRAGSSAISLRKVYLGNVEQARIDFGGGVLGSRGGNCILGGNPHDVLSNGFAAALRHNWWGQAGGPEAARLSESQGGNLDVSAPLAAKPEICSESPA